MLLLLLNSTKAKDVKHEFRWERDMVLIPNLNFLGKQKREKNIHEKKNKYFFWTFFFSSKTHTKKKTCHIESAYTIPAPLIVQSNVMINSAKKSEQCDMKMRTPVLVTHLELGTWNENTHTLHITYRIAHSEPLP